MNRPWLSGLALGLAIAQTLGCNLILPQRAKTTPRPVATRAGENPAIQQTSSIETPRVVDLPGQPVQIIGKVKLLSEHGAGVISNNTGNIIANNSGGLVANNAGNVIAHGEADPGGHNSGGLVGKVKRQLLDAGPGEALLAEARIEVLDAAGQLLVDKAGKPITGTSDETGSYQLSAALPDENLVLRVRLFPNGGATAAGGQLFALLPRGRSGDLDLDTASSLGARFVLDRYVERKREVLDRLPAAEATRLHEAMEGARGLLGRVPSYRPADLLSAAAELKAKHKPLDDALEHIKTILIGQANLGTGLPATEVALTAPNGVSGDAAGNLYITESTFGRVRRVAPDGTIDVYAGGRKVKGDQFLNPMSLLRLPDGTILVADALGNRVRKIATDGTVSSFAGDGNRDVLVMDVPATQTSLRRPSSLALGPDGAVYIGEVPTNKQHVGRLLRVDTQGLIHAIALPTDIERPNLSGLAVSSDGTIYVVESYRDTLRKRTPDGTWTTLVANSGDFSATTRLAAGPDDAVYLARSETNLIERYAADGTHTTVAGTGDAGFSPDGTPAGSALLNQPSGMWFGPDGSLYFADSGNGLVRKIALGEPDQPITTVAGTRSPTQTGNATTLSISSPGGMAIDPEGRLVVAEASGHTIKRLDGNQLTVIAGSTRGKAEESVPALQAHFETPAGMAYVGAKLYIMDASNRRIRLLDEKGLVTSIAGPIDGTQKGARFVSARQLDLPRGFGIAIGPDQRPYFAENQENKIWRLNPDGQAEVIAGLGDSEGYEGDGGPALTAKLRFPTTLAFDSKGDLYFADVGNMVVRKITGLQGGGEPQISTVAGIPLIGLLAALGSGAIPDDEGKQATEAVLVGPMGLAFDKDDNLYITEAGTGTLGTLTSLADLGDLELPPLGPRIRRVSPDGTIRTIAGDGTTVLNDPETDNVLVSPIGIIFDKQGRLVVADSGSNQIKILELPK